ncbi:MAG: gamma-glutamylcyclotransferase [Pseudomonadota bacterium]
MKRPLENVRRPLYVENLVKAKGLQHAQATAGGHLCCIASVGWQLVLALDPAPGHSCRGVALRVEDGHEAETLSGLRERELVSSAYLEAVVDITLSNGHQVTALTYIVDQDHVQYCGGMELEKQATIIAQATGGRGDNTEYLWNTSRHLEQLGIDDPELRWLDRRVRALKQS